MLPAGRALLLSVLLGIGSPAYLFPQVSPGKALEKDTPQTTAAGVTFTAPAGWSVSGTTAAITILAPEGDTPHCRPSMRKPPMPPPPSPKLGSATSPGSHGLYEPPSMSPITMAGPLASRLRSTKPSPNERAVVVAIARRAYDVWSVVLLDGAEPTFEKRSAISGANLGKSSPRRLPARVLPAGESPSRFHPRPYRSATRSFVEASMKKFDIPGAGFALIDQGKVVYEGGIGVKELGKPDPVDAHTLFMAASNTKGMTTLLLAKLVDEKKLDWNEFVTKVYPNFRLADATVTQQVEIRHLICACTGLPRQDLEWLFEYKKYKPASTFTLLSGMRPPVSSARCFNTAT